MIDNEIHDGGVYKEIFLRAFELVKNPETFTTKVAARAASGDEVSWYCPTAVCWCSIGAIHRVSWDLRDTFNESEDDYAVEFRTMFQHYIDNEIDRGIIKRLSLVCLNDDLLHEDVVKLWEKFGQFKGYI